MLRIGTSGYSYPHWKSIFYPDRLPSNRWLSFYAQHFNTVELNVTFYRLPPAPIFESWHRQTPPGFSFGLKGNRFITHIKGLKQVQEPLRNFFDAAGRLGEKLGVILWQLPPDHQADPALLSEFCSLLKDEPVSGQTHHAFEFRHRSWFNGQIYRILQTFGFALCEADPSPGHFPEAMDFDFVYLRFHGSRGPDNPKYSTEELRVWADRVNDRLSRGLDVYAYFNNDSNAFAVANARELIALAG